MSGDGQVTVIREEITIEKFDGDPADGKLTERVTMVNGEVTMRESFGTDTPTDSTTGA